MGIVTGAVAPMLRHRARHITQNTPRLSSKKLGPHLLDADVGHARCMELEMAIRRTLDLQQ